MQTYIPNADIGSGSKKGILQQYSTFCSSLERDVKNYYFLLYEEAMKKIFSLTIAALLSAGMALAGCGGRPNGIVYPDYPRTPADKDSWEYNDEKITIDWYVDTPGFSYPSFGSDKVSQIIEEKTGVSIRFTAPVDNDGQYLSNLISTNSLPDVITVAAYTSVKDRIAAQDYIYPIDELAARWAPTLTDRIEPDIHAYYEMADGNIYGLPSNSYSEEYLTEDTAYGPNGGFLVRKDLYEWYVGKYPQTDVMSKDGFYEMVKTVVETFSYSGTSRPEPVDGIERVRNMNGILLDPFTSEGNKSVEWLSQYFAAPFEDENGDYVDTRTTAQYREALEFLNKAYNEGLVSESNLDYNASEVGGRIANGAVFCTMVTAQDYASSFVAAWNEGDGFEYIPIIFTNAAGDDPILQDLTGYGYLYNMITTNAERPDIIIKLFDFLWSDEGQMLCQFGVEDETYRYTDAARTKIEYTEEYKQMKNEGALYDTYGVERLWLFNKTGYTTPLRPDNAYTKELLYTENLKRPLIPVSYMYNASMPPVDSEAENYNSIINDSYSVDMVWAENLTGIISASEDEFGSTLDGVLADMRTRGMDRVTEFYRPAYRSFLQKLGYDSGWPAYREGWTSKIKNADGSYKISPNGDSKWYIVADTID